VEDRRLQANGGVVRENKQRDEHEPTHLLAPSAAQHQKKSQRDRGTEQRQIGGAQEYNCPAHEFVLLDYRRTGRQGRAALKRFDGGPVIVPNLGLR
jgi:hypothetical protein